MKLNIVTSSYNDLHKLNKLVETVNTFIQMQFMYNKPQIDIQIYCYCKDDSLLEKECILIETRPGINFYKIPNNGRCDYAFFIHLVENYHTHADKTIFVKINWFENNINLLELLSDYIDYDYAHVGTHRIYIEWEADQGKFCNEISKNIESFYKSSDHPSGFTYLSYYNKVYPTGPRPGFMPYWANGPCFIVSKRLLLRHPIEVYKNMVDMFYFDENSDIVQRFRKIDPTMTLDKIKLHFGIHVHELCGRFWKVFYTHQLPPMDNLLIMT
jgi:hypothetical protein